MAFLIKKPQAPDPLPETPPRKKPVNMFKKGDPRIFKWTPEEVAKRKAQRMQGTKRQLDAAFMADLIFYWRHHGIKVIERVGRENPTKLMELIVAYLPKQDQMEVTHHGGIALDALGLQEIESRTLALLERAAQRDITSDSELLSEGPLLPPVVDVRKE